MQIQGACASEDGNGGGVDGDFGAFGEHEGELSALNGVEFVGDFVGTCGAV